VCLVKFDNISFIAIEIGYHRGQLRGEGAILRYRLTRFFEERCQSNKNVVLKMAQVSILQVHDTKIAWQLKSFTQHSSTIDKG